MYETVIEPVLAFPEESSLLHPDWRERDRWHSAYSATPLNSRGLETANGRLYTHEALDYVGEFVHDAALRDPTMPPLVYGHLEIAVFGALMARIEENEQKSIPLDADAVTAEIFMRACIGSAEPNELMTLLSRYPAELGSLELAKQTVAGDVTLLKEMDSVIERMLVDRHAKIRDGETAQNVRYSMARIDDPTDVHVATVVRKADIAVLPLVGGESIKVVQRDSVVVDLARPISAPLKDEMSTWLRVPETRAALRGNQKARYRGKEMSALFDMEELSGGKSPLTLAVRSYYAHTNPRR